MLKNVISLLALSLALVLSGCATTGPAAGGQTKAMQSASPEVRSIEKWKSLINRDFAAAWEFQTPGARSATDRESYVATMNTRPVSWLGVRFVEKECAAEDSCLISLELQFQVGLGGRMGTVNAPSFISERWIRVDGVWYYAPADLS